MNTLAPVSTIMSTDLITVNPEDKLLVVKEKFDNNRIHHLPVVRFKEIVGIISKVDLLAFLKGAAVTEENNESYLNNIRLKNYKAEDIMTKGLAKLESTDRINVAVEVFKENLFHAIPVVDNNELVGIVTVHDIIKMVGEEEMKIV
jgi:acetoin utilization protein AcuB